MAKKNLTTKKRHPWQKPMTRLKANRKKKRDKDPKKEVTHTCDHCQKEGHIEVNCWQKDQSKMPKLYWKKKDAKTEKATAAVEVEHLLSVVGMEMEDEVKYDFHNNAAVGFLFDMNDTFIKFQVVENNAFV